MERGEESLRSQIGPGKIERTGHRESKKLAKPREDRESGAQKAKTGRLYPEEGKPAGYRKGK